MGLQQRKYAIHISKQYLNFSSAHFLIFDETRREPLHGHNYRVRVTGESSHLDEKDMVFDFLDIKPLVKKICNTLDHKLLLPEKNEFLHIHTQDDNWQVQHDKVIFSFPQNDVLIMPLHNISSEALANYLFTEIEQALQTIYNFTFDTLSVEVEESPGQSAIVHK